METSEHYGLLIAWEGNALRFDDRWWMDSTLGPNEHEDTEGQTLVIELVDLKHCEWKILVIGNPSDKMVLSCGIGIKVGNTIRSICRSIMMKLIKHLYFKKV